MNVASATLFPGADTTLSQRCMKVASATLCSGANAMLPQRRMDGVVRATLFPVLFLPRDLKLNKTPARR